MTKRKGRVGIERRLADMGADPDAYEAVSRAVADEGIRALFEEDGVDVLEPDTTPLQYGPYQLLTVTLFDVLGTLRYFAFNLRKHVDGDVYYDILRYDPSHNVLHIHDFLADSEEDRWRPDMAIDSVHDVKQAYDRAEQLIWDWLAEALNEAGGEV